jgi:3-deoxy-D-manno-octulosonic-acid transferase
LSSTKPKENIIVFFAGLLIYRLILRCYALGITLAAPFNKKAALWVKGRKKWRQKISQSLDSCNKKGPLIWIHCASLGEFEQGRPLIEALRIKHPNHLILLSFFSPSGFELKKNYEKADIVCYLPIDNPRNAQKWVELLNPSVAIFVKYEFWYDYLSALKSRKVPIYLVSGIFRPNQPFFKSWGSVFRKMLGFYTKLFVQNEDSLPLLDSIGIQNVEICGDTRVDRVLQIKAERTVFSAVDIFKNSGPILVCGSTWQADESIIIDFWHKYLAAKGWKIIIAPHEIHEKEIDDLKNKFSEAPALLFSETPNSSELELTNAKVLIIDNVGILSRLYRYANAAYIGGGFGKGIHNTLEAAVYEIPIFFGPNNKKFAEAQDLLELGIGFEIENRTELSVIFESLDYDLVKANAAAYIEQQRGATDKIMNELSPV